MKYDDERTKGIGCGNWGCSGYDPGMEQNCANWSVRDGDPVVATCENYVPEGVTPSRVLHGGSAGGLW